QILAMKTAGTRIDNMLIKEPLAIKMAFGENPKTVYNDKNQSPSTRMATAAIIREALEKAKEHLEQINSYLENTDENIRPDLDVKSEALIPLLEHEIPIHAHVHRADDIFTAIRIAKEFELDLVLVHCTEGHLVANELSKESYPVLAGPILTDRSKPELKNQSSESPKILNDFGIKTAIITDHPETPEKLLPLCAALAVRDGLNFYDALRAITIVPAEVCGISDRVGSLEVGKDADIVVWKTSPLDIMEKPLQVFCNGELFQN
ncbi:MAG: amidohydrolase family protein, partial [Oscillospiraceae bacterium]